VYYVKFVKFPEGQPLNKGQNKGSTCVLEQKGNESSWICVSFELRHSLEFHF